ncbi:hypothetical protein ABFY11_15705, partial [Lactiplantibacillus plantarum]
WSLNIFYPVWVYFFTLCCISIVNSPEKRTKEGRIGSTKKHYADQETQISMLKRAMKGLEHHEIFQSCNLYLERGWVTSDDLEDLDYLYQP